MRRSSTQKDIMWLPAVSTRMYTAATDMISRKLPRKRSLYPTLAAAPIETFREAIKTCEHIMNHPEQGARIMGLHLEGNYLNMAMKGGQDPNYIYPPDPQEYKELLNSTQCIKRWSAAPELDGALVFGKYASAHGVLVSLASK